MSITLLSLVAIAVQQGANVIQQNSGEISKFVQQNRYAIVNGLKVAKPQIKELGDKIVDKSGELYNYLTHKDEDGGWTKK